MATNEYDIVQGNISRRRELLDALTKQSLTPSQGQMVGQVYVGPSLLDALSKPLMALAGSYAGSSLDKEEAANSQARQSALVDALSGIHAQPGTADFTREAVGSNLPEVQQMGLKNFEALLSPKNIETYGAPVATGPSGELTQFSNRGRPLKSGVNAYQKPDNKLQIVTNPDGTQGLMAVDPNQGIANPIEGVTPYVRPPAQTNINNNMSKQEGQFGKTLGQKDAERFDASNTALQNESAMQSTIQRFKAFEDLPVLRGGLAPLATKAAQIGATLGIPVPENISNTEQLNGLVQNMVVEFIKQGGRGITDEEGQRLVESVPGALSSPEGAKKLRMLMEDISQKNIRRAKATQGYMRQRYPEAFQGAPDEGQMAPGTGGGIKFLGFE